MSPIRGFCFLASLIALVSGCYTLKLGPNEFITPGTTLGAAWSVHDKYTQPPNVDPANFQPAGGTMAVETHNGTPFEISFTADFRERLNGGMFWGLTSTLLTGYIDSSGASCGLFCQKLRYSEIIWWDEVIAEDVFIKRSPSFGIIFGLAPGDDSKTMVQYATSIRWYKMAVETFKGLDCVNCQNSSYLLNTAKITSGLGWRHALELGGEELRGSFWVEFDGLSQVTMGVGLVITDFPFRSDISEALFGK